MVSQAAKYHLYVRRRLTEARHVRSSGRGSVSSFGGSSTIVTIDRATRRRAIEQLMHLNRLAT